STHNTRFERLWVEVAKQFVRQWRGFFTRLERMHRLNCANPHHLWLLQHLFLDLINGDCDSFAQDWNLHPLSEHSNQSPLDLRFINELLYGAAVEEFEDIDPDILQQYYSVLGNPTHRRSQQTGAGYPSDEEDSGSDAAIGSDTGSVSDIEDSEENILQQTISSHIHANVNHKVVKCPRSCCPFADPAHVMLLDAVLRDLRASGLIPVGYGLRTSEWVGEEYPASEWVRFGRNKGVMVDLPSVIWMPRAIAWVHGLYAMQTVLYHFSN
ncbi:hypothetical protein JB92DRAFT_2721892, partial [Gautieria morchelliformis]